MLPQTTFTHNIDDHIHSFSLQLPSFWIQTNSIEYIKLKIFFCRDPIVIVNRAEILNFANMSKSVMRRCNVFCFSKEQVRKPFHSTMIA